MRFVLITALLTLAPFAAASAQPRVPDAEMWGVGGDVGIFFPQEGALDTALELQGLAEYYFTPRVSIRTAFGWTSPSFEGREDDGLRISRLTVDVQYNWEGGTIHPFIGGGIGAYFLRLIENGEGFGDTESDAGLVFGGGIEYFTARTVTIKGEARYHIVNVDGVPDGHGLSLTIGLKKYF
jgi:opacity protein-like surface antigen